MKEITGNFWSKYEGYDAIVVTTNCVVGKDDKLIMGAGMAKQFADHFPNLPKQLGKLVLQNGRQIELLESKTWQVLPGKCRILALPTKNHFKDNSVMEEVKQLCKEMEEIVTRNNIKSVLTSRPGCGLGGLNWAQLKPYLKEIWDDRFTVISPDERTQRNINRNFI